MRVALDIAARAALALVLAALVWIVAMQEGNPVRVNSLPAALPVARINQPPGTMVYEQSADSVRVTLRAPLSLWEQFTPDQFKAEIDLKGQPYGPLSLPVKVSTSNRAVEVVRVEPSAIELKLEQLDEQSVPVTITIAGAPALGYAVSLPEARPSQVKVRGPRSFVAQVSEVTGTVSVQEARQPVEQTIRLQALDKDGRPVPYVTLTPENVQVHVGIEHLGGFRDLAVKVVVRGRPAQGYRITNITVSPPIVTVFGSSQAIDQSPGYVETAPVNIADAQDDVGQPTPLNLPGGLSLLGDPAVQVRVQIEAIQGGLTMQRPLTILGLAARMDARLSPEAVDVILSGPLPKLQSLSPDDVRVVVDLVNLGPGTHQVAPQVIVPQGIVAESILPATIQVTIGPAGTLQISPVATPTRTK